MRPPRSDYEDISRYYDTVRGFGSGYFEGWYERIERHGDLGGRERLLEVGCGTGRYTALLASRLGRPVVGLDLSIGMLAAARERAAGAGLDLWLVRGEATRLPFRDGSFDAALLVLVVHHVEDLDALASELCRVLAPGGRALFMTRGHQEIRESYIAMFPGVLDIDLARFPPVDELEGRLASAGFEGVDHVQEANPGFTMTVEEVMDKVDGRFISTLSLMDEEEFQAGREVFGSRMRRRYGEGPVPTASFTLVWGDVPG